MDALYNTTNLYSLRHCFCFRVFCLSFASDFLNLLLVRNLPDKNCFCFRVLRLSFASDFFNLLLVRNLPDNCSYYIKKCKNISAGAGLK